MLEAPIPSFKWYLVAFWIETRLEVQQTLVHECINIIRPETGIFTAGEGAFGSPLGIYYAFIRRI